MRKLTILSLLVLSTLKAQKKPNVLFIMSDDHASNAIGVYQSRLSKLNPTPTIDKIAKEGMIMTNTFCHNAICSPSRAAILTGQYNAINGVTTLGGKISKDKQYIAHGFKKAGYQTAVIGKWHLGTLPLAFDYYKVLHSQGAYFNPVFSVSDGSGKPLIDKKKNKTIKDAVQMKGHSTDCITDSSLDWLKSRDKNKPFFLKLHFKAPHGPFDNAPRYDNYLKDIEIPEPHNLFDFKEHGSIATKGVNNNLNNYIGSSVSKRNKFRSYKAKGLEKSTDGKSYTKMAYQHYLKKYLRCVKGIDDNIKRVIDYLKKEGIYNNTVIVYTADQGFYLGEHDYIDKRWGYEEGARMPFIIRYPKTIKAGGKSDAIVENVDFAPTLLDFAGVATPEVMQGKSFKHILENQKEPKDWKKAHYYHYALHMAHHYNPAHIGIRTKKFKLLYFYGTSENPNKSKIGQTPPGWELYDLEKDPSEDYNVYNNKTYEKVIKTLKSELKRIRKEYKVDGDEFSYNKIIEKYWDYSPENQKDAEQIALNFEEKFKGKNKKKKKSQKKKKIKNI